MASKIDQSTEKMKTSTTKSILLKHGLMPTYQDIQLSTEHFENYLIKLQQQSNNGQSTTEPPTEIPPQLKLDEETTSQIIILHSYFYNFCTPSPSIGSIVNVYLLELHRLALLHDNDDGSSSSGGDKAAATNFTDINCEELPKETIIQTQSNSYPYIIKLLSSNTNKILLKLPMVFQLSFFRILIRLLSGVTNDEYDLECLFDFDSLNTAAAAAADSDKDGGSRDGDGDTKKSKVDITGLLDSKCRLSNELDEQSSSSSDDDSYNFIRKSSLGSSRARDRTTSSSSFFDTSTKSKSHHSRSKSSISGNVSGNINSSVNRARTTSSEITIHKPNNNNKAEGGGGNGKAYTAWSFGRWKKKKNAPLYSIVRYVKWIFAPYNVHHLMYPSFVCIIFVHL